MRLAIATVVLLCKLLPATAAESEPPASIVTKLCGTWSGGACAGNYTFRTDGTFVLRHFSPGDNTLTGNWSLRPDGDTPTLQLAFTTSDYKVKAPDRAEYAYVGKILEVKLIRLDDEVVRYEYSDGNTLEFERLKPVAGGLPIGVWRVEFANGVTQTCDIQKGGRTTVTEPQRTSSGRMGLRDKVFVVRYADDRIERWTPVGQRIVVEHWFPASQLPTAAPVLGIAERVE